VTSDGSCFEHNTVNTAGFGATDHSLLSSCVQIVWFSSAILFEHVDGIDVTAWNNWASHS